MVQALIFMRSIMRPGVQMATWEGRARASMQSGGGPWQEGQAGKAWRAATGGWEVARLGGPRALQQASKAGEQGQQASPLAMSAALLLQPSAAQAAQSPAGRTSQPAFRSLNCWCLERPPKAAHTPSP